MAANVFRFADVEVSACLLAKEAATYLLQEQLTKLKDTLSEKVAGTLLAYRRHCASATPPSQFILPEALKLLPIYALSILKTKAIKGGTVASDVRVYHAHKLASLGVAATAIYLYPRVVAIHDLDDTAATYDPDSGGLILPSFMRASYLGMQSNGCYVIDNGDMTVLWVGGGVSTQILLDLFGFDAWDHIGPHMGTLPKLDTLLSKQVHNLLGYFEAQRGICIPFQVARQNIDAAELEFSNMLVEDENNDGMPYVDYICFMHKQISVALSNNTTLGVSGWKIW
jgi:protein transport protein SEC24